MEVVVRNIPPTIEGWKHGIDGLVKDTMVHGKMSPTPYIKAMTLVMVATKIK